jgi:hypothetical protein
MLTMLSLGKLSGSAFRPLLPALLPGILLAVAVWQSKRGKASADVPLREWDIPHLAAYLKEEGLDLRIVATRQNGIIGETAFLTTTDKEFQDFNRMPKAQAFIHLWEGSLYCERGQIGEFRAHLTRQWGDCCLVAEPFIFFGDRKLLDRVGTALSKA